MAMSRDRVKFKIGAHKFAGKEAGIYRRLLAEHFKIDMTRYSCNKDVYIVCRPSQFARFLIARAELGAVNVFAELEPKLIPAEDPNKIQEFDVSSVGAVQQWTLED